MDYENEWTEFQFKSVVRVLLKHRPISSLTKYLEFGRSSKLNLRGLHQYLSGMIRMKHNIVLVCMNRQSYHNRNSCRFVVLKNHVTFLYIRTHKKWKFSTNVLHAELCISCDPELSLNSIYNSHFHVGRCCITCIIQCCFVCVFPIFHLVTLLTPLLFLNEQGGDWWTSI